jgi:DNA-binding MarR family transcriptional regulator
MGSIDKKTDDIRDSLFQFLPLIKILFKNESGEDNEEREASHLNYRSNTLKVLETLVSGGPMPISMIGKKLMIAKQNMTAVADRLIREGLIVRDNDKTDRRVINLSITRKGTGLLKNVRQTHSEMLRKKLSKLSKDDSEILIESLQKLTGVLKKLQ